ncbi:class I SAM-dependent methyltransferase [bacterium]|nr:class I SAM-dependent methyltransferase [bacterium]
MSAKRDDYINETALIKATRDNWDSHWKSEASVLNKRRNSFIIKLTRFLKRAGGGELLYRIIKKEVDRAGGRLVLEAGCGSGDVSLRLAENGIRTVLLDTSFTAVNQARERAVDNSLEIFAVNSSIFHIPFKDDIFDACFNSGVVDHFGPEYRSKAVSEVVRITRETGRIIILTNDIKSLVHAKAMSFAQRHNCWRYGFKDAVKSLSDILIHIPHSKLIKEYSRGFISQFEFLHYYLPGGLLKWLFFRLFFIFSLPFNFLNRIPGHFLVTIIEKQIRRTEQSSHS